MTRNKSQGAVTQMEEARQGNAVRITRLTVRKAQKALDEWLAMKVGQQFTPQRIAEVTALIQECLWAAEEADDRMAAANNLMRHTRDMRNTQEHLSKIGIDTITVDPRTGKTYVARSNRQMQVNPMGAA
jgi:hypothetical protein